MSDAVTVIAWEFPDYDGAATVTVAVVATVALGPAIVTLNIIRNYTG